MHFTVESTPAGGGENTYTWIGDNVTTTADEWVRIGGKYTLPTGLDAATLYVEAEGNTPFLLDDVLITALDGGGGGPEPGTSSSTPTSRTAWTVGDRATVVRAPRRSPSPTSRTAAPPPRWSPTG